MALTLFLREDNHQKDMDKLKTELKTERELSENEYQSSLGFLAGYKHRLDVIESSLSEQQRATIQKRLNNHQQPSQPTQPLDRSKSGQDKQPQSNLSSLPPDGLKTVVPTASRP
jgi:hypothetical protein